jgi:hypothetical protein
MTAKEECEQKIQEKMAKGMTRDRAAAAVFKADPELRERMIEEANADRTPPRRAART